MADVGTDLFSMLNTFQTKRQGPEQPAVQPAPPPGMVTNQQAGELAKQAAPAPKPGQVPEAPAPTSERTLADDGGLSQFMAIQKAAQEAQRKAQLGQSLAHAGASIGAALTRSPSMRESLTTIAGQRGGAAGGSGDGVGNLSADAFLNFQKRADLIQERGRFNKNRAELAKQFGISEGALQNIYDADPKKIADMQAARADPTRELKVLEDGTIMSVRKNAAPGEQPIVYGVDQGKVDEGRRKDIELKIKGLQEERDALKAPLDRAKTQEEIDKLKEEVKTAPVTRAETAARTAKIEEETLSEPGKRAETAGRTAELEEKNRKAQELRTVIMDPEMRKHLAAQMGTDEATLYTQFTGGKLDEAMLANMNATPLYQTWLKTDRSIPFPEFVQQDMRARTVNPMNQSTSIVLKQVGERGEKLYAGAGNLDNLDAMRSRLDSGVYGGSMFQDYLSQGARELGSILGIDNQTLKNTQEYESVMSSAAGKIVKQWGANASNTDREAAEKAIGGSLKMTDPDSIRWMLGFQAKTQVWETLRHNADIDAKIARSKNEDTKEALRLHKQPLPDADRIAKVADIPASAIAKLRANPSLKADFDAQFGRELGAFFLGENQ